VTYKPKFISFDCYGTLINFEMGPTAKKLFEDRVPSERMPAFLDSFRFYRLDEVLGEWKPFFDVVENAIQRTCKKHGIEYRPADALALYEAVPTWQPHPNVVETLEAIAPHVPLVILSKRGLHRRASLRLQAAGADVRIHVRSARLRAGADDARLLELSLRPDDSLGSGLHGQGLHRPWSRACQMEKALFFLL
jgi:hypothetical protein